MNFENWQIICLVLGGLLWLVFEILSVRKNKKAKKAKKENEKNVVKGDDVDE